MAKAGRKNLYETQIKYRLDEIAKWIEHGATEKQVAHNLGIAHGTLIQYKKQFNELDETIKKAKQSIVLELRGALVKKAVGYDYTETKTVTEQVDLPEEMRIALLDAGFTREQLEQVRLVKTEVAHKKMAPDVAAINLALKNYDKDNWANDPQMLAIRKKELELRERQIENNEW